MNESFDVAVVGGGVAGLVAAVTAAQLGASVVLVEGNSLGGRARTTARDGYLYNVGPHALYLGGHLHPLLDSLGLHPRGGLAANTGVRLLRDGEMFPLSFNALDIMRSRLLSVRGRARVLSLLARLPRLQTDRFVGTTWQHWLGNERSDVAGLLAMLVRTGTYVHAPDTLDAAAALDQLKLALHGVRYLDGGWQTIVDALAGRFRETGGTISDHRHALAVREVDGGAVIDTDTESVTARSVVLAGLSPAAVVRLTGATIRGGELLSAAVTAAVLDLALASVHDGPVFGIDEALYLSPHAPTAALAPPGAGLVTLLRYTPSGTTGDATADRARLASLAAQAGIAATDIVHERFSAGLLVANGYPTARAGGLRGRPTVDALGSSRVFIAGDWVGPEFQLADAASASAAAAARRAVRASEGVGRVDA